MEDQFKLYVLKSNSNVRMKDVCDILKLNASSPEKLGPIRRDFKRDRYTKDYSKTSRFITLIAESLFNKLVENGYGVGNSDKEFTILEYEIRSENRPPEDSVMHCFFPVSETNRIKVCEKLSYISSMSLIASDEYYVHNEGIVEFSNKVSELVRIKIKIIMDNPDDCRISWCRNTLINRVRLHFDNDYSESRYEKEENDV